MPTLRLIRVLLAAVAFVWFLHWAAGRRAFALTLGGMWFMLTRKPVVILSAIGAGALMVLMLPGALERGGMSTLPMLTGIALFCGPGFAALVVGPVWMLMCVRKPKVQFELPNGETPVEILQANHLFRRESRGGHLHITDKSLHFIPTRFVVQNEPWHIERAKLRAGEVAGMRLLVLHDDAGAEHMLALPRPDEVRELLQLPEFDPAS